MITFMIALLTSEALPLPYSPRMDDGIAALLLGCFFLSAYVLSRSHKFLFQLVKDFLLHRDRTSIFASSTAADMRYLLLLILQTCILGGVYLFSCFNEFQPTLVAHVSPVVLLSVYILLCMAVLFIKWVIYSLLGWIFFDESRTSLWIESYSTLLYYVGFALFPFVLFIVYFNLNVKIAVVLGALLFIFMKLLVLYKWLKLFCDKMYGFLFLILYFCALEIVPYLVLYRGMEQLNDYLVIKI